MTDQELTDNQWLRIEPFAPGGRKGKRGPRSDNCRFINALIWMARSGGCWRDLPEQYGNPHTVKKRYYRWIEAGVLEKVFRARASEADMELVSIDSTSVRAHAQAATARRKNGGSHANGLGRSRAGLTIKIHAAVDALGLPVKLVLSPGQCGDVVYASALIEGLEPDCVIADRAYDAWHLYAAIEAKKAIPVIPPRDQNRKTHPGCDWTLYKELNLVERFFAKIKQFRRVATRYDKLGQNFFGFILLAAIVIWLK